MSIDLRQCDPSCMGCVKGYKKKHERDSKFTIVCNGIPLEYIPKNVLATIDNEEDAKSAIGMLDPVSWAAQVIDWHCLDPDGEVWKRKSRDGNLPQGTPNYYTDVVAGDERIFAGKSPFNRPYQAEMLRCTAKRKVFRIGRQAGKTETLIIAMLHALYTNKNFKVVLIAPFQAQIELIFSRIEEHLNANQVLYNSKKRMVKAPNFTLELHNGSYVRAFTAGTQSKSNAGAARGQSAHMLVFDEADYLSEGDIAATLAMVANYPEATVWMSSTPTGKRERFYDTCHSKLYKEFHYTSRINPNWTEALEDYFKGEYGDLDFKHEIEAEFGEQQQGVFQVAYVEAAKKVYDYSSFRREATWQYCIGVDWNSQKVGTTIVVVGFHPIEQKFYLVDRHVVSREGWTQLTACDVIAKLNRKWIPQWIYIDRGYGSTQSEVLRKYGLDQQARYGSEHIDARLGRIVKEYDFGSQLEIRDPFTKQPVKKFAKAFLVENAVRRFETRSIYIPEKDKQLEAELLGYIIDHVTATGVPIFKQGNEKAGDHNLDALMLALVAFTLEMSDLGKARYMTNIAFAGKFGQKTQVDLFPMVVKQDEKVLAAQNAANHRPDVNKRASTFEEKKTLLHQQPEKMPANNSNVNQRAQEPKIWSWKGFYKDAPKPKRDVSTGRTVTKPPGRKKF